MNKTNEQGPASKNSTANFNINMQYLKDLSFESPAVPEVFFQQNKNQPQIKVDVNVEVNKIGENHYEVVLGSVINAAQDDKKLYLVETKYAAIITVNNALNEMQTKQTLMVSVPNALFPFIRFIVANIIREGGFASLVLEPIDFDALYRQHINSQTNQPTQI